MANVVKTAQEMQDEIFRNMSADEKVKVGSYLWKMAKEVVGNKINDLEEVERNMDSRYSSNLSIFPCGKVDKT